MSKFALLAAVALTVAATLAAPASAATGDGQAVALGTVSGTPAAAAIQPQQTGCSVVSLSVGPLDANVAGLVVVQLDPIALDVRLEGLVGTLVCGVLGGVAPAQ
jgi:hypothetical protein